MTRMWTVQGGKLVEVPRARLDREERIEDWIAADPKIAGLDVLIIGRQVTTDFGGRIDLLALDRQGHTTIIELKRDKTPRDIVAQVLDYASWVRGLTTKQIHETASRHLPRPLEEVFPDRFGERLPEDLNGSHSMLIVASEIDESSKRILEYLATEHGVNINTAFFNVFRHEGAEFVTADWLMNQEEVAERSHARRQAPWSGYWYVNVTDGDNRSWEDQRKYGFVAAGYGRQYSRPLENLKAGDPMFAYMKGAGYVGFGIVEREAIMAKDFSVGDRPLLDLALKEPKLGHDRDDEELAEYVVGVDWKSTTGREDAKRFKGAFANQNIVCRLRDQATIEYLKREFGVVSH